jgi:glucose/mannose transport system substrate-binding protein
MGSMVARIGSIAVAGMLINPAYAENKTVDVLHFYTSGSEASAVSTIKSAVDKQGFAWEDVPVAGGGGDAAWTALRARASAGNPPTAAVFLGYVIRDYADAGMLSDLNSVAQSENWDAVVPDAIKKFAKYNGKWIGAPINVHSVNWVWINRAVLEKIGGKEPHTFDELIALLEMAKAHGVTPLALGGQDWQEAILFDAVIAATAGPDFYRRAMNDLDDKALRSADMKRSFDNLRTLLKYTDANFAGRDWGIATAMVINGEALMQTMGEWAKGEFKVAGKISGKDYLCERFPGTEGTVMYHSDMFGMFKVASDRRAGQEALAKAVMSKDVQLAFNSIKGSAPARIDVNVDSFDDCGKKAMSDFKKASETNTLVGAMSENYGGPPAVTGIYKEVVTQFVHGQISTS